MWDTYDISYGNIRLVPFNYAFIFLDNAETD